MISSKKNFIVIQKKFKERTIIILKLILRFIKIIYSQKFLKIFSNKNLL